MLKPADKLYIEVDGLQIAYHDIGSGDPIVFLHGNPTSSFTWRNIIPHVQHLGRCIAPDLIGMGDSDPLPDPGPGSYSFEENQRYLDGFFAALGLNERVTLVVHDWGSALGFEWARRHPDAVKGIVHMEAIVGAIGWDEMPTLAQTRFRSVRSAQGEELVLQQNVFIESIVRGTLRTYTEEEMAEYRRPYLVAGESRRPMLSWPRQVPLGGEPAHIVALVENYAAWLAETRIPKLCVHADPGTRSARLIERVRSWPNQQEITVKSVHYPQEDAPHEIGAAIAAWLGGLNGS